MASNYPTRTRRRFRGTRSLFVLGALAATVLHPGAAQAQITSYSGPQIANPTGTLTFTWHGFVPLIAYQEAGLQVSCNSTDSGQACTRCCRPTAFSLGGYYYGGPLQQLVTITRADGGALSALEFQAGDLYNGCEAGDGTIYLWALVSSGGNTTSFDIDAPAGTYVGFAGVFDTVKVGAYSNAYARNLHEESQPQAIAMDNMRYVASPCPAFAAPTSINSCADGTSVFSVSVVGDGPLTYQWQWQPPDGSQWFDVSDGADAAPGSFAFSASGSQTPTLTRTGTLAAGSVVLFRCVVSNACATIASAPATLAIRPTPTISEQPQDQPLCGAPAVATFSVAAATNEADPGPFTYQWQTSTQDQPAWHAVTDSENTTGATTPYLALSLDATDAAGQFRCVVSNPCGSTTSTVAKLSFGNAPVIDVQPLDTVICGDGTGAFSVSSSGLQQPVCQWRVESPPSSGQYLDIPSDATFADPATGLTFYASGSQSEGLSVSSVVLGGHPSSIRFVAVLSSSCGNTTSSPAKLIVNTADFNGDGDIGTDADIQAFFACLAGDCCATCGSADFNGDGDIGTDADIESFFRVLAGGPC
jgi:hypothetical protein